MKLNKDTRNLIKVDSIIKYGNTVFQVVAVQEIFSRYGEVIGKQISVRWLDATKKELIGATTYGEKLSNFYGYEIIKE